MAVEPQALKGLSLQLQATHAVLRPLHVQAEKRRHFTVLHHLKIKKSGKRQVDPF